VLDPGRAQRPTLSDRGTGERLREFQGPGNQANAVVFHADLAFSPDASVQSGARSPAARRMMAAEAMTPSSDRRPDPPAAPHPPVLVIGSTFAPPLVGFEAMRRAAEMIGRCLARTGFGLVTGNPPGVDSAAASAFWSECRRQGRDPGQGYRQLWLPHFSRGYWMPGAGFRAPPACVLRLETKAAWIERAMDLAGAVVMVGGRRRGSLAIARRFIDAGKPVLPIPFVGGESRSTFEEILRTWRDAPVPGLSQGQFLRLAVPWISDTGTLANLLLGTLASRQDIFVSYRRSDGAWPAGRLHADLVEHFGPRRVFFDLHAIAPSAQWLQTIETAAAGCRVGIVVIGPDFLASRPDGTRRLDDPHDVMRLELTRLVDGGKTILPVLIGDTPLPTAEALPEALRPLLRHQARTLGNDGWGATVQLMIDAIEAVLKNGRPGG
jgi:hypothetical protein